MQLRDLQILDEKEIDVWVQTLESSDRRRTEYARVIKQWQMYVREQELAAYEAAREQEVTRGIPAPAAAPPEPPSAPTEAPWTDDPDFAGAKLI
jgi:hypothetical protein